MQPVMATIYDTAVVPYEKGRVDAVAAVELGAGPLRQFMLKFAREKDLALFLELAKEPRPARPDDVAMRVVLPAYILSETESRLPDWGCALSAFSGGGHGGSGDHHFGGHAAIAAGGDFDAAQDSAVCHGGWMGICWWVVDESFS